MEEVDEITWVELHRLKGRYGPACSGRGRWQKGSRVWCIYGDMAYEVVHAKKK